MIALAMQNSMRQEPDTERPPFTWACAACTFLHVPDRVPVGRVECAMCGTDRPELVAAPAPVLRAEQEVEDEQAYERALAASEAEQ